MIPCGFSPAQARSVLRAARQIDHIKPPKATAAATALAQALRAVPAEARRTLALAITEIALRDSATPQIEATRQ